MNQENLFAAMALMAFPLMISITTYFVKKWIDRTETTAGKIEYKLGEMGFKFSDFINEVRKTMVDIRDRLMQDMDKLKIATVKLHHQLQGMSETAEVLDKKLEKMEKLLDGHAKEHEVFRQRLDRHADRIKTVIRTIEPDIRIVGEKRSSDDEE